MRARGDRETETGRSGHFTPAPTRRKAYENSSRRKSYDQNRTGRQTTAHLNALNDRRDQRPAHPNANKGHRRPVIHHEGHLHPGGHPGEPAPRPRPAHLELVAFETARRIHFKADVVSLVDLKAGGRCKQ